MFCPNCGKADQSPETYCRQCGNYLYDYDKPVKRRQTPEDHIKANAALNLMTAISSVTLSILLFSIFLGRPDTHPVIYVTAGFLLAITAWQIQTFWRTMLLRQHFKKQKNRAADQPENPAAASSIESPPTRAQLNEADFENFAPASVVERTTKKLKVKSEK
jgi:hypothetical protein